MMKRMGNLLLALVLLLGMMPMMAMKADAATHKVVMTADEFVGYLQYVVDRGDSKYGSGDQYSIGKYDGNRIYFDCWGLGESIICTKGEIVYNRDTSLNPWNLWDTSCGCGSKSGDWLKTQCQLSSDFTNLVPGEWLFRDDSSGHCYHVGYYIGNGKVIESTSDGTYNTQVTTIDSGGHSNIRGSSWTWTSHGKVPWIEYTTHIDEYLSSCDEYPSNIKLETTNRTTIKTLPCSKGTNADSKDIKTVDPGAVFTSTAMYQNTAGGCWYQVQCDGQTGYLYAGDTKRVEYYSGLSISGVATPSRINQGSAFTLKGNVKATYLPIGHVRALIQAADGDVVLYETYTPASNIYSYSIEGGVIDRAMTFNTLSAGTYTYTLFADVLNYYSTGTDVLSTTVQEHFVNASEFTVVGSTTASYTISYNANGGAGGPGTQTVVAGGALVIPTAVPQKLGYSFLGWGLDADSTSVFCVPGETIGVGGDTILYAVWAPAYGFLSNTIFSSMRFGFDVSFPNEYAVYQFTPISAGYYDIYTECDYDTVVIVYDSQGNIIASDDDSGDNRNFYLHYDFQPNQTYYLQINLFGTSLGFFDVIIQRRSVHVYEDPADLTVKAGETATFHVGAIGTGLTYEWYCAAPGETTAYYVGAYESISVTGKADNNGSRYFCIVYDDVGGHWTSGVATLSVVSDGWVQENGSWYYYQGGHKVTGWLRDGSYWYYLDASGAMQTGWTQVGGKWYYMNKSGVMQTGWLKDGGYWYYLDSTGAMQTGWVKVGSNWYYMNKSGVMQTGWVKVNGYWYYMASGGAMQTGWVKVGSNWYYMSAGGAMQTGWVSVGGKWYYMASGGAMQTGWLKDGNYWYYLDATGVMLTGTHVIGGKTYVFNKSGVWIG